jgi:serine/threonine-protein kinase
VSGRVDAEFLALQEALAGEYSLERELGRGGMGVVYLAREVQLNRLVAIKVLPAALAAREESRARFVREARMAASLSHPHVVPIHRVGEAGGFVFFVMTYVEGETLGERLRSRGPLTSAAATRLLREVAWALAYAHGRGVVHRDVKPDNILLETSSGRALVTDFGIARHDSENEITDPGKIMGTAHFMSPEQASSQPLDGRSDLYSLGIVAFLALSGRLPFDAQSVPGLLAKHLSEPAPPLASVVSGVPRQLAGVVDRCLLKAPTDRFPNGEALADALEAAPVPQAHLPVPLRVWANTVDPLRVVYAPWILAFGLNALAMFPRGSFRYVLGVALLPVLPWAGFHIRKTMRVLGAGYSLADLRLAVRVWQTEKREQLAYSLGDKLALWAEVLRAMTWAGVGGSLLVILDVLNFPGRRGPVASMSLVLLTLASLVTAHSLGVPILPRGLRARLTGALRTWFWNSNGGALIIKLLTPERHVRASATGYRPTEMALALAVSELFDALPKSYRANLSGLPQVAERLEAHAAAARERLVALDSLAAAEAHEAPSLSAERERAKKELADSVAALESVRLDLLRLHGGATDLRPITTVLEAARLLGDELDRLTRARIEADEASNAAPLKVLRPETPA